MAAPRPSALDQRLRQLEARAARDLLHPLIEEPALLGPFADVLADLALPAPWARLRDTLLAYAAADEPLETEAVLAHLIGSGFDRGTLAVFSLPSRLFAAASMPSEREELYGRLMDMHQLRAALRLERENRAQAWDAGDGAAATVYGLAIADLEERLARIGRELDGSAA